MERLMDRFVQMETHKQLQLQQDCPVHVHCYRCAVDWKTGAAIAQMRMVNRSERTVSAVFLRVDGLDENGFENYSMRGLALANCNARPHSIFGEEKTIVLKPAPFSRLRIWVQCVTFSDGVTWCASPQHAFLPPAAQQQCICGMRNEKDAATCGLCGKQLSELPISCGAGMQSEHTRLSEQVSAFKREIESLSEFLIATDMESGYEDEKEMGAAVQLEDAMDGCAAGETFFLERETPLKDAETLSVSESNIFTPENPIENDPRPAPILRDPAFFPSRIEEEPKSSRRKAVLGCVIALAATLLYYFLLR